MTDAEFSVRIVEFLGQAGPRNFLMGVIQEAREALIEHGFEFGTPEKPSCASELEWFVETVGLGSRLRLTVQMFDPAGCSVMLVRASVYALSCSTVRGKVHSWVEIATLSPSAACTPSPPGPVLVRQSLFVCPPGNHFLGNSQMEELLLRRLSGGRGPSIRTALAALARAFAVQVDVAMSP